MRLERLVEEGPTVTSDRSGSPHRLRTDGCTPAVRPYRFRSVAVALSVSIISGVAASSPRPRSPDGDPPWTQDRPSQHEMQSKAHRILRPSPGRDPKRVRARCTQTPSSNTRTCNKLLDVYM